MVECLDVKTVESTAVSRADSKVFLKAVLRAVYSVVLKAGMLDETTAE